MVQLKVKKLHSQLMDELTKILKWEKVSFPSDSARFGKPLFAVHENHLESFVKNTDSQTSYLENVINGLM